jgi:hypothetical protein
LKKPILHVVKYETNTEKRRALPLGGASIDVRQAYTNNVVYGNAGYYFLRSNF